ncbi:MAG: hypothetical protein IT260_15735, partial [Saprospiraceae bacterium]|nr:hypothetical protein [Saprospiraceae bacterium]
MNKLLLCGGLCLSVVLSLISGLSAQAPGSLDNTFGTGGIIQTPFLAFPTDCRAMVVQADGKIVLGGVYTAGGVVNMAFARYNTLGVLDNTFGTAGKSSIAFNNQQVKLNVLQRASGNKIIAAGSSNNKPAILRLTSAGAADNTFGTAGIVEFDGGLASIVDLVVLPTGKLLGCGISDLGSGKQFAVFRRNADGSVDNTFGTNGFAYATVGLQPTLTKMTVQGDGKILLTGTIYFDVSKYDMILTRMSANGVLDNTFDTDGIVTTILSTNAAYEQGNALAIQQDGKIVVAGRITNAGPTVFAIVRYNTNGSIDNTFGTNGSTTLNFNNSLDEPKAISLQSDGKIVVAGSSVNGANRYFALARLNKNGSPDTGFDGDGKVTTAIGTKAWGEVVVAQSSVGKILVAGYAEGASPRQFALARYNSGTVVGTVEAETGIPAIRLSPNPA